MRAAHATDTQARPFGRNFAVRISWILNIYLLLSWDQNVFHFQTGINCCASISKHMCWPPLQITFTNEEFEINMCTTLPWLNYDCYCFTYFTFSYFLSVFLSPRIHPSTYPLPTYLYTNQPSYLKHLSIYLSTYLSIYLSACLSAYLSLHGHFSAFSSGMYISITLSSL